MIQDIYKNSTFPLDVRVKSLISLLTLDEKISLLPTRQAAIERLNISEYSVGGEAAHGVVSNTGPSTVFSQPLGLASTFDEKLLEEIGSVIGDEARIYYDKSNRKYGLTLWAPTIDMERDPRWGRTEEAYGEDPILTGKLSSNLIKGMQGYDDFYLKLVPAPKHFYGNNNEEGRIYCSSSIDKRNKNEYYLKAFKPAFVEGKAKSMMTAYNSINGTPCILNKEVQDIVKDTWRCDGFIVCDGGDFSQTVDYHKYYKTHAETIAGALKAGIDCFTDDAELVINAAKEAISRNLITEKDIDKAISNILKIRFRLGQFDDDSLNPYANICSEKLCSKSHSELSLKACLESIVLLKNENNILPLKEDKINSIAILGPLANEIYRDWYCGTPPYKVTMLDGIKNKLINKDIKFHNGNDIVKLSVNNEHLFNNNFEICDWGFGSITLKDTYTNKYLTLEEDDNKISPSADSIWGWFVKEVFKYNDISDNNFTLRTWDNGKISFNNELLNKNVDENSDLILNKKIIENGIKECTTLAANSDVAIVVVGNHPLINGKEEIDRTDLILPPSQEELIKSVYSFKLNSSDLEYFDVSSNNFILESGKCSILIGSSSKNIKLKKDITIIGETLKPRNLSYLTKAEDYDSCNNIILDECSLDGTCVTTSKNNLSWLKFSDVDLKNYSNLSIEAIFNSIANIEIRIDSINGDILGSLKITTEEIKDNWNNHICKLKPLNSINDLYLVINGDCLINSLKFI